MQETARRLRADESLLAVEPQVAPLHEVFRLQGDAELAEAERRYLPARQSLSAVVLAAGEGTDFGGLTARVPKAMLRVQGRPILARLLDDFAAFGGRNAVVVRGYRAEAIDVPGARFVDNPDFASTGEAYSLSLAEGDLGPGTLVAFGDIVLKRHIIQALLEEAADGITLAVDSTLPAPPTPTASSPIVPIPAASASTRPVCAPSATRWRRRKATASGSGSCTWAVTAPAGSCRPFAWRAPTAACEPRPSETCWPASTPPGTRCGSSIVGAAGSTSMTSRAWSMPRASEARRDAARPGDQTDARWNSSVLPSGSLHSIWTPPPGCVFSTYLMPSRSSVAFIAS